MRTLGISGALKAPSAGSLVKSALRLPSDVDWSHESGLEYLPEACGTAERFLYCDNLLPEKSDPVVPAVQTFKPFVIYYPEGCGTLAIRPAGWEARSVNGLAAQESSALALELNSSYNGVNPDLLSTAVDVSPASPNEVPQTILGLIHAMVACGYSGDITFHAPAWALPSFLTNTELTLTNGVYKLGHHTVVFDAGYTNQAPTDADPLNTVASDADVWIYATTPVEYAFAEVRTYGVAESMKGDMARQNTVYVVAERPAIVRFDSCCVFAALAKVC